MLEVLVIAILGVATAPHRLSAPGNSTPGQRQPYIDDLRGKEKQPGNDPAQKAGRVPKRDPAPHEDRDTRPDERARMIFAEFERLGLEIEA